MALTTQDSNWLSDEILAAKLVLDARAFARDVVARWNNNDLFNQLDTVDIEAAFPGIDKAEVTAGINALNTFLTAMGDDTSGQASNLYKLRL